MCACLCVCVCTCVNTRAHINKPTTRMSARATERAHQTCARTWAREPARSAKYILRCVRVCASVCLVDQHTRTHERAYTFTCHLTIAACCRRRRRCVRRMFSVFRSGGVFTELETEKCRLAATTATSVHPIVYAADWTLQWVVQLKLTLN